MKCVACGDHPLNYIHCDRWDCPLLVVRAKIEGRLTVSMPDDDGWVEVLNVEDERGPPSPPPTLADFVPMATRGKAKGLRAMGGWPFNRMPEDEDGRDPEPREDDEEEDDEHSDQNDPA